MGTCMSKKTPATSTVSPPAAAVAIAATPLPDPPTKQPKPEEVKKTPQREEEPLKKKEIFIIKQRKSHERRPEDKPKIAISTPFKALEVSSPSSSDVPVVVNGDGGNRNGGIRGGAPVRTSSCTKEEVDAILIQCGRLSRSSSGKAISSENTNSKKYSGSKKRSYDFDHENERGDDVCVNEENRRHHQHSRSSHRRTPSRERDPLDSKRSNSRERDALESKRSNSRDRYSSSRDEERTRNGGSSSSSRRVSRSPGKRSETGNPQSGNAAIDNKSRPGKMVSVPASASGTTGIKRVSVKRSGEVGHRTTPASPRSQSPANGNGNTNAHHHQQPSLSRSSSRKAEQSPYRRNPMNEIDDNCLALKSQDHNNNNNKGQKVKETELGVSKKPSHLQSQKPDGGRHSRTRSDVKEQLQQQQLMVEDNLLKEVKGLPLKSSKGVVAPTGVESVNPQTITRSRSSRKSRDFDLNMGFNPDTLLNPTSYASLLLEDIQNFHQQNTTATTFTLPPCVTKACSIVEAVADLNSCTGSSLSTTFTEERSSEADRHNKNTKTSATYINTHIGKRRVGVKDPFVESELAVNDDIMEPSLHKYITVRRSMVEGEMEQQESAGSNSFVGQHWVSNSSSWEPNSADSTDRWTSQSKSEEELVMGIEEPSLLGPEKQILRCNDNNSTYLPSLAPSRRKRSVQMMTPIKGAAGSM